MKRILIIILTVTLLHACASLPQQDIFDAEYEAPEYIIGTGDQLYISVWQNPDLSLSVPVRPDGKISAPLIGDAQAEGLSAKVLSEMLTVQLSKYIRVPKVTVIITAANSSDFLTRVRITGAVNAQQSLPYRRDMTVLDLVLQAGGLTPFADADNSLLYRKTPNGTVPYRVNIDDIISRGILTTNYELRPSDILIIPESVF
ncbi:MAG: polysaccharide export outer membrane protein [Moritella sp.]|jgi:polysaccharide export outer membrane protein